MPWFLEPSYHEKKGISGNCVASFSFNIAIVSISNKFGLFCPFEVVFYLTFHLTLVHNLSGLHSPCPQQTQMASLRILIHIQYSLTMILLLLDVANSTTFLANLWNGKLFDFLGVPGARWFVVHPAAFLPDIISHYESLLVCQVMWQNLHSSATIYMCAMILVLENKYYAFCGG